jgi:hypothetical protein
MLFLAGVDRILYGTKNPFLAGNFKLYAIVHMLQKMHFAHITKYAFLAGSIMLS